jgi:hypothetical protein
LIPVQTLNDLFTTPTLTTISLAINTTLQLFICLSCQNAQTSASILEHFRRKHPHSLTSDLRNYIQEIAGCANILSHYPTIHPSMEPVIHVSGLPVSILTGCSQCPYVASKKCVAKHIQKEHSLAIPQDNISAQCLNIGVTKVYFRVKNPSIIASSLEFSDTLLYAFNSFDWTTFSNITANPNARMISPWLMRTGWHNHILGFDIQELCQLVAMPEESEFPGLHSCIKTYFADATNLIDHTDLLVLQRLNTPNPGKT